MNSALKAKGWVEFLAAHPSVPFGSKLADHFAAGHITRLCDCGCNSFDLEIPKAAVLEPLCEPGGRGMFFEIQFESDAEAEIACLFFVDERGYLESLDVTCGGSNHAPLPDQVTLGKVLWTHPPER
jgi:hypothetical protein